MSDGSSKNTDCASFDLHLAHIELETKGGVKREVFCDDTMHQSQCEVKVGNIDLEVITLQALLEAGEKQFTNWKVMNSKSKGSSWRKHISEGVMRKVG